jgi:hypothetical protein
MGPMTLLRLGSFVTALAVAAVLTACTADVSTSGYASGGGPVFIEDAGGGDVGTVSPGSPDPSHTSLLAVVDPNVKMTASPGEGVGVFTEYDSGGHWQVWWTCDTSRTSESCPFDVKAWAEQGAIVNASSEQFAFGDTLTTPSTPGPGAAGGIEAKTVTTTGTQGVLFDTDPGATITLTVTIGGLYSGQFLFWVQGGRINGGYTGSVTDPLMLVGASP